METTLATIMVTAAVTAAVIGLGVLVWEIAQLKRKVSRQGVLCSDYEMQLQGAFNEIALRKRNHDDDLKQAKNDIQMQFESVWRKFEETEREIDNMHKEVHRRIDSEQAESERNLDKRFDSIYRKMYKMNSEINPAAVVGECS